MKQEFVLIQDLWFDDKRVYFLLSDNRTIGIPRVWFSRLKTATKTQLSNWELIADGIGVHWPDLDEDISAAGLFTYKPPESKHVAVEIEPALE